MAVCSSSSPTEHTNSDRAIRHTKENSVQPAIASYTTDARPAPTDAELLARVMRGDEWALDALRRRYERLVYAIALRITRDHMVAEEVVQDVMLAIWQSAARFRA